MKRGIRWNDSNYHQRTTAPHGLHGLEPLGQNGLSPVLSLIREIVRREGAGLRWVQLPPGNWFPQPVNVLANRLKCTSTIPVQITRRGFE